MAIKLLSSAVQSHFSSSTRINSYKGAIEELVYNSLDAGSTSVAIRLHIQEHTIQVIDNGNGITRTDINNVGRRHMTSKTVDLSSLKGASSHYGFRGQSLASIIEISQVVKITSRSGNKNETWVKTFHKSKEKGVTETVVRASKGTTVDVQGFLFNQPIQKRAVNFLNEIQDIKQFLEQLSLVHNNISISLRDNSKNDIIFQIHKCRDIYQTLSTLFDIEKEEIQEFQVEKKNYKVTAYIGKKVSEENGHHWVYVNGRFMSACNLHQILDSHLAKLLCLKKKAKRSRKIGNVHTENEDINFKKNIPFYFVFVTCPYNDYDVNNTIKQSILEFKDWKEISKLLEKLVKFYGGDVTIKEQKLPEKVQIEEIENKVTTDLRDQVRKIMEKYLGGISKNPAVSQMQNGRKGKMVKRNKKRKRDISLSKVIQNDNKAKKKQLRSPILQDNILIHEEHTNNEKHTDIIKQTTPNNINNTNFVQQLPKELKKPKPNKLNTKMQNKNKAEKKQLRSPIFQDNVSVHEEHSNNEKHADITKQTNPNYVNNTNAVQELAKVLKKSKPNKLNTKNIVDKMRKNLLKDKICCNNNLASDRIKGMVTHKKIKHIPDKAKTKKQKIDSNMMIAKKLDHKSNLLDAFQQETSIVKRRCKRLAMKVDHLLRSKNMRRRNIVFNESSHYNSIKTDDQNITWKKKVGEIIVRNVMPMPPKFNIQAMNQNLRNSIQRKQYSSSNDLFQTILKTQSNYFDNVEALREVSPQTPINQGDVNEDYIIDVESYNSHKVPLLTYESHAYHDKEIINPKTDIKYNNYQESCYRRFITKQSRDNFTSAKARKSLLHRTKFKGYQTSKNYSKQTIMLRNLQYLEESSYTIEFSKTDENNVVNNQTESIDEDLRKIIASQITNKHCKNNMQTAENDEGDAISNEMRDFTYTLNRVSIASQRVEDTYHSKITEGFFEKSYYGTYTIEKVADIENERPSEIINDGSRDHVSVHDTQRKDNLNVVFVSKSQDPSQIETSVDRSIDPLNVCETVINSTDILDVQLCPDLNENSGKTNNLSLDSLLGNGISSLPSNAMATINEVAETSPHFNNTINTSEPNLFPDFTGIFDLSLIQNENEYLSSPIIMAKAASNRRDNENVNVKMLGKDGQVFHLNKATGMTYGDNANNEDDFEFNIRNRPRFVPKGLSPIFKNNNTRNACNLNLVEDYFGDTVYDDFMKAVETNTEIFEENIDDVNNLTTKDIVKVNTKLRKDNAALNFDGDYLKEAKVLGQVDTKFIAAKMKGKSGEALNEYLVLFDQHAVHERIRLETNLAEYLSNDQWKSVTLDEVVIKLKHEDILYLHNYREKFEQLGLKWNLTENHEICVTAIPEAILGKHTRQVEIIMKAVKSLILEEIEVIKSQKGSLSLYPKSIMDLVFSEACRYAIKFGDHLFTSDCVELLTSLSECKTPFQCAHGRPVMAVIMDTRLRNPVYQVNLAKLKEFKKKVRTSK